MPGVAQPPDEPADQAVQGPGRGQELESRMPAKTTRSNGKVVTTPSNPARRITETGVWKAR